MSVRPSEPRASATGSSPSEPRASATGSSSQDPVADARGSDGRTLAARWLPPLLALLAAVQGAGYWIVGHRAHPEETPAQLALFRYEDISYYPLIRALSDGQFREFAIEEARGTGVLSFPYAILLPHAVCLRLFGDWGLAIADTLVAVAVYAAAYFLFRTLRVRAELAAGAAALVATLGLQLAFNAWVQGRVPGFRGFVLWDSRIPRTYVTAAPILMGLAFLVRLAQNRPTRRGDWLGFATAWAVLVQADIYTAFSLALVGGGLALVRLLTEPERMRLWGSLTLAGGLSLVLLAPFLIQRAMELPDVPRRFGAFAVDRRHPLIGVTNGTILYLVLGLSFTFLAGLLLRRATEAAPRRAGLRVLAALVLATFGALPLWCIVVGKTLQVYHFPNRLILAASYAAFGSAVMLLDAATRRRGRWIAQLTLVGAALASLALMTRTHEEAAWVEPAYALPGGEGQRASYVALTAELAKPEYTERRVVATFDLIVFVHQSTFAGRSAYLPDAFASTVADDLLEERALRFGKLLGISATSFERDILSSPDYFRLFSCMKYQASRTFSFAPADEYPPEVAQVIRTGKMYQDDWKLVVPASELRRLRQRYATMPAEPGGRLDLIVLRASEEAKGWTPDAGRFRETYRNRHFAVWVAR